VGTELGDEGVGVAVIMTSECLVLGKDCLELVEEGIVGVNDVRLLHGCMVFIVYLSFCTAKIALFFETTKFFTLFYYKKQRKIVFFF